MAQPLVRAAVVRIDDGMRVRMLKSSIVSNRTAEKELKAQKEQPK